MGPPESNPFLMNPLHDLTSAVPPSGRMPPPPRASHSTLGVLAEWLALTVSNVHTILTGNGLRPHQVRMFEAPRHPRSVPRV